MFKKLIVTGIVVVVGSGLLMGTNLGSYVSTTCERVSDNMESSVPLDFQIDRARNMIRDLEPEIRRSMHVIAKEEVQVESLNRRIAGAQTKADKAKAEIIRLQSDLQTGESVFRYAGNSYSAEEVKQDLSRRFNRYKTTDATLDSLKKMRDARQRNLEAARQKLTAMMAAQRQLQVEVENLEAKLKLVEVAQASSDFQFDDSQLARAKQLMNDIQTKLDVAARLANADVNFQEEIPLDEETPADITDQVAEYFQLGGEADPKSVALVNLSE
jgi:chromosome segregation ATPase